MNYLKNKEKKERGKKIKKGTREIESQIDQLQHLKQGILKAPPADPRTYINR